MFFLNIIGAMDVGWQMPLIVRQILDGGAWGIFLRSDTLLMVLALLGIGSWLLLKGEDRLLRGLGLYMALSAAVACLQLLKVGSYWNYLMEPFALAGPAAVVVWRRWLGPESVRPWPAWAIAAAVLLLAAWPIASNLGMVPNNYRVMLRALRLETPQEGLARDLKSPALLFEHAFTHPDPATHALADPLYYCLMLKQGRIEPHPLLERLSDPGLKILGLSDVSRDWLFEKSGEPRIRATIEREFEVVAPGMMPRIWVRKLR